MKTITDQIVKRFQNKGRGFVFTAKDFLDLGNRGAVDMALSSLAKSGKIRRLRRGLYHYPKISELFGDVLAPDFDQVAHAIARNSGVRIQPVGAVAANLLGLSEQVPAKIVYLTNGLSRTIRIGSQTITFKKTSPKDLLRNKKTALIIQALRFLGEEAVTDEVITKLRAILSPTDRRRLLEEARYASTWIPGIVLRIAGEQSDG